MADWDKGEAEDRREADEDGLPRFLSTLGGVVMFFISAFGHTP
jgi:hypothetical protein